MFGRRSKFDRSLRERGVPPEAPTSAAVDDRSTDGPYDVADAPDTDEKMLDFGALKIPIVDGFNVRLEIAADGAMGAVTVMHNDAILQLSVFAAPRSGGAWQTIREDICAEIKRGGGTYTLAAGEFGREIHGQIAGPDGLQDARFIGVDGPRWFLRGLLAGTAGSDVSAAEPLLQVLRRVVVSRGTEPKPVREPLTLMLSAELASQLQDSVEDADVVLDDDSV